MNRVYTPIPGEQEQENTCWTSVTVGTRFSLFFHRLVLLNFCPGSQVFRTAARDPKKWGCCWLILYLDIS